LQAIFLQQTAAKKKPFFDSSEIIIHNWIIVVKNVKRFFRNFIAEKTAFLSHWFI
jgi:hypothetical protein